MTPAHRMEREFITKARAAAAANQANCCKYCFEPFTVSPATAEHRVARSKGGSNLSHNIDAACARCNKLKGSITPGAFLKLIKSPPPMSSLELLLAGARRSIWLKTHRASRAIGRAAGFMPVTPIGRKAA